MGREDYARLGSMLGVAFDGADATSIDDGIAIPSIGGSGAKYLQLIMRSVYRESTLEFEYNYEEDHNLDFNKLVQIDKQIKEYKSKTNRLDFADMILSAKNKKIKGKEHLIGAKVLTKGGKYKTTKKGRKKIQ